MTPTAPTGNGPATPFERVTVPTPIGDLTIVASPAGVVLTAFEDPETEIEALERRTGGEVRPGGRALTRTAREVERYFAGRGTALSAPADLSGFGGGFPRRVLKTVRTIPYGELWTYGDVAGMAGSPRGGRAAGNALNRCPIELFVPCHRVVHASGSIGGYGRHEERKRWLIRHESGH